ncbi:MAG: hypothetical protein ACTSRG_16625 [Candidatus Helarchaeota archaeon]
MKEIKWRNLPLKNLIIQVLLKNKAMITDTDLYSNLTKEFKYLSHADFSKTIMALEVEGIVNVTKITKTKNKIELIDPHLLEKLKQ